MTGTRRDDCEPTTADGTAEFEQLDAEAAQHGGESQDSGDWTNSERSV